MLNLNILESLSEEQDNCSSMDGTEKVESADLSKETTQGSPNSS